MILKTLLISFLLISTIGNTQEIETFNIEEQDIEFYNNQKSIFFSEYRFEREAKLNFDSTLFNFAQQGIYVPSTIHWYFDDLESEINSNLTKLKDKDQKFFAALQKKTFAGFTQRDVKKYASAIENLKTDETLRFCFYALYDLELAENSSEIIMIDWEKQGLKSYNLKDNPQVINQIRNALDSAMVNDCTIGIGEYAFNLTNKRGRVYQEAKDEGSNSKYYSDEPMTWHAIDQVIIYFYKNEDFKIRYAHIKVECAETVECPKRKHNPFEGSVSGSGAPIRSGEGLGSGGN